jgi:hypothetical protein
MHISNEGDPYLRTLLVQGATTSRARVEPTAICHDGPETGRAERNMTNKYQNQSP